MSNRINKFLSVFVALIIVASTSLVAALPVSADEGVGFSVNPAIPANQIDKNISYFYLQMQPKEKQVIQVEVSNTSSKPIVVEVEANSGLTNSAGNIEYKAMENRDESMIHAFSDIAKVDKESLEIPPNSSVTSSVTIEMPDEEYDGKIIGGLVFTKVPEDEPAEGITITNVYSYVIGVVLQENNTVIEPDFELVEVVPDIVNYRTTLVHRIRNPKNELADDMKMDIKVFYENETEPKWEKNADYLRMAPNTTMDYAFYLEGVELDPGDYTSKVHIECNDEDWDFEYTFNIKAEKAKEINEENLAKPEKPERVIPTWMIVVIIVLGILLIALIILLIVMLRRNKDNNNQQNQINSDTNDKQ